MAKQTVRESTIVANIMKYLNGLPNCKAEKTHGGFYGNSGKPDITGCIKGRRFEIEVKTEKGVISELQLVQLELWRKAGAVAFVAKSVEDVKGVFVFEGLC